MGHDNSTFCWPALLWQGTTRRREWTVRSILAVTWCSLVLNLRFCLSLDNQEIWYGKPPCSDLVRWFCESGVVCHFEGKRWWLLVWYLVCIQIFARWIQPFRNYPKTLTFHVIPIVIITSKINQVLKTSPKNHETNIGILVFLASTLVSSFTEGFAKVPIWDRSSSLNPFLGTFFFKILSKHQGMIYNNRYCSYGFKAPTIILWYNLI